MNYQNLASAIEFYRARGYYYAQDAPWVVGHQAYDATKPAGTQDVRWGGQDGLNVPRYMVASGEQSFIQMMLDGKDLKRACCITPCYRIEKYNDWNKPYFMKVELINAQDVDEGHLLHMVHEAASFFETLFQNVRIKKTGPMSYDIVEKDSRVELGSYGIRQKTFDLSGYGPDGLNLKWIYGTGCAEPRVSTTLERTDVKKR